MKKIVSGLLVTAFAIGGFALLSTNTVTATPDKVKEVKIFAEKFAKEALKHNMKEVSKLTKDLNFDDQKGKTEKASKAEKDATYSKWDPLESIEVEKIEDADSDGNVEVTFHLITKKGEEKTVTWPVIKENDELKFVIE